MAPPPEKQAGKLLGLLAEGELITSKYDKVARNSVSNAARLQNGNLLRAPPQLCDKRREFELWCAYETRSVISKFLCMLSAPQPFANRKYFNTYLPPPYLYLFKSDQTPDFARYCKRKPMKLCKLC